MRAVLNYHRQMRGRVPCAIQPNNNDHPHVERFALCGLFGKEGNYAFA